MTIPWDPLGLGCLGKFRLPSSPVARDATSWIRTHPWPRATGPTMGGIPQKMVKAKCPEMEWFCIENDQ